MAINSFKYFLGRNRIYLFILWVWSELVDSFYQHDTWQKRHCEFWKLAVPLWLLLILSTSIWNIDLRPPRKDGDLDHLRIKGHIDRIQVMPTDIQPELTATHVNKKYRTFHFIWLFCWLQLQEWTHGNPARFTQAAHQSMTSNKQ